MSKPKYPLKSISKDKLRFEFESVGTHKIVLKLVEYEPIDENSIYYNLALVDMNEDGSYSDKTVTDNKDTEKIFATIAQTIDCFFQKYPSNRILIYANDRLRIRLYRMAISNYWNEKEQNWAFYGLTNKKFERFEKGKNYEALYDYFKIFKIKIIL